jgi:Na+-transporting NADH:ubiquinone oxidoreductase subunit D
MNGQTTTKTTNQIILDGLWRDNPIFRQILGICSTLAVTNNVTNTAVMCISLSLVTALSCATVSALKEWTPKTVRMMVQVLIIAVLCNYRRYSAAGVLADKSRKFGRCGINYHQRNCQCDAVRRLPSRIVRASFLDGLFSGLGYSVILLVIAAIREVMGMGTLAGYPLPYFSTQWDKWVIMVMPPGAFFVLACLLWVCRSIGIKGKKA